MILRSLEAQKTLRSASCPGPRERCRFFFGDRRRDISVSDRRCGGVNRSVRVYLHHLAKSVASYKCSGLRVTRQKRHTFINYIEIGRLEATADADGDIGRSSTMDQSKELDLCFSELYWSSFLDYAQKKRYRNKTDLYF